VVVFSEISFEKAVEYNDFCFNHKPAIGFIKSETRGHYGHIFVDFGPNFVAYESDESHPHVISSISNGCPPLVSWEFVERIQFEDGDSVIFSEVYGMAGLNDGHKRKITKVTASSFTFDVDTTDYGTFEGGSFVIAAKKAYSFSPLTKAISDPYNVSGSMGVQHLFFQALYKFTSMLGRLPVPQSEDDGQEFIRMAREINDKLGHKKVTINPADLLSFAFDATTTVDKVVLYFAKLVGQQIRDTWYNKDTPGYQVVVLTYLPY
jgi:ubiquitin-activating enzyme E1